MSVHDNFIRETLIQAGFSATLIERCVSVSPSMRVVAMNQVLGSISVAAALGLIAIRAELALVSPDVFASYSLVGGAASGLSAILLLLGIVLLTNHSLIPSKQDPASRAALENSALAHLARLVLDTRHDPSGQAETMLKNFSNRLAFEPEGRQIAVLTDILDPAPASRRGKAIGELALVTSLIGGLLIWVFWLR